MTPKLNARSCHKRSRKKLFARDLLVLLIDSVKARTRKVALKRRSAHDRRLLSNLSDHQLRDIGLTREHQKTELGHGIFDITSQRYYDLGFGRVRDLEQPGISKLPKD